MATPAVSAREPSHAKLTLIARNELTTFVFARTTMSISRWQTTSHASYDIVRKIVRSDKRSIQQRFDTKKIETVQNY